MCDNRFDPCDATAAAAAAAAEAAETTPERLEGIQMVSGRSETSSRVPQAARGPCDGATGQSCYYCVPPRSFEPCSAPSLCISSSHSCRNAPTEVTSLLRTIATEATTNYVTYTSQPRRRGHWLRPHPFRREIPQHPDQAVGQGIQIDVEFALCGPL